MQSCCAIQGHAKCMQLQSEVNAALQHERIILTSNPLITQEEVAVSQDFDLLRLAESCEAHAAVAASALTALALTQPPVFDHDWEIPVTIKPGCVLGLQPEI